MNQTLRYWFNDIEVERVLPAAEEEVIPGVNWGHPCVLFTPAYWLSQHWMSGLENAYQSPYRAHDGLPGELVFCMLGGYGITAELATAAFNACRKAGLIDSLEPDEAVWASQLQKPLTVNGKLHHYRYPNQKARFIAGAMQYLRERRLENLSGKNLRDRLLEIKGVGPKTAGWVVRNLLDSDEVAILDIHLIRAGQLCDLFEPKQKVERDYFQMEARFIEFCNALNVRPAVLDCLIWDQMRAYGPIVQAALRQKLGINDIAESRSQHTTQMNLSITA